MATFTPSNEDLILANDLNLWITSGNTDVVVAYATSVSVSISSDSIDTSNKMSPRWAMFLAGSASYEVSTEALYTRNDAVIGYDWLMEKMVAGDAITWKMGTKVAAENDYSLDTTKPYYSGKAVITSLSLSAGNNEVASCSATLTGTGAIALNKAGA